MASNNLYVGIAAASLVISLMFLVMVVQKPVDSDCVIETPGIPKEKAIISNIAKTAIRGDPDKVFQVVSEYKGYSSSSPYSGFQWDGELEVGTTGKFKMSVEGFPIRYVPIKLTYLNREKRIISESTTHYPKWLLGSERVQEVVPLDGKPGFCEYRTWQTVEGLASYYLLFTTTRYDLAESLRYCAQDLKEYVENSN